MNEPSETTPGRSNPFPGLRPFQTEEDYLFFGRESQTAALLTLLREHRFLAVVGASGSGKSSLVRAGLIPALHGGAMARAGSHWEVAVFRPGGDPMTNLARALLDADLYEADDAEAVHQLRATLTRSRFGLVEAVRQSDSIDGSTNLFVLVDQFEELFRFRERGVDHRESAAAFVKLLLTASEEKDVRIYVALTMRSDYLGDSAQVPGLAQAINKGEFLIPRLSRDQKREAIEKPVGVGGAQIAPRLTQQMLNDVGDDPDQLPILQHALMRTWNVWMADDAVDEPLDLPHYERTGGMETALSQHADEIYDALPDNAARRLCEKLFRTLSEKGADNRGIRRPTRLAELEVIAGASRNEVLTVLEAFRAPGVTFVMPGLQYALGDRTVIDLSHESLMRVWTRLRHWVDVESQSASVYRRLAETAALWEDGKAGLYRDPDLGIASTWWEESRPTEAWAAQYGNGFVNAVEFLEKSREAAGAEERRREEARQRELEQARNLADTQSRAASNFKRFAGIVALLAVCAVVLAVVAFNLWDEAELAQERTQVLLDDSQHERGKLWLERAHRQLSEKKFIGAKLMAAQAIGFEGCGRETAEAAFRTAHPRLLKRDSAEWQSAIDLIQNAPEFPLAWSTPIVKPESDDYHPALSPDGSLLVWADHTGRLTVWDGQTGQRLPDVDLGAEIVHALEFLSNRIAALRAQSGTLLYDFRNQGIIGSEKGYIPPLRSADPSWFAVVGEKGFQRFDSQTGAPLGDPVTLDVSDEAELALHPDGRQLLVVREQKAELVDLQARGASVFSFEVGGEISEVEFSADGKFIVMGSRNGERPSSQRLVVRDAVSRDLLYEERVEADRITAIAGSTLVLSSRGPPSRDRLFDLAERRTIDFLPGRLEYYVPERNVGLLRGASTPNGGSLGTWDFGAQRFVSPMPSPLFGGVLFAKFHPSGESFVSSTSAGLCLWSAKTGEPSRTLRDTHAVAGAFSPDGRFLALCGDPADPVVRLCDAQSGEEIRRFEGAGRGVAFDPRSVTLAIDREDGKVAIVELETGTVRQTLELVSPTGLGPRPRAPFDAPGLSAIHFHPNGRQLLTVRAVRGEEDPLKLWDLPTGRSETIETDKSVTSVAFHPSGSRLAWVADDGIRWTTLATGEQGALGRSSGGTFEFSTLTFSPDGLLLAAGEARRGRFRIWDVESQEEIAVVAAHSAQILSLEFAPDGRSLLSASADGTMRLWEVTRRRVLVPTEAVLNLRFQSDGDTLLVASRDAIEHRDATNGRLLERVQLEGDLPRFARARFSSEGRLLALIRWDSDANTIGIWDTNSGRQVGALAHDEAPAALVFDPVRPQIVSFSRKALYFWNAQTLERERRVETGWRAGFVADCDIHPKGKWVAVGAPDGIELWDLETRTRLEPPAESPSGFLVRFQPESGRFLASANPSALEIWSIEEQRTVQRIPLSSDAGSRRRGSAPFAWTADGSQLLYGRNGDEIFVYDLESGRTEPLRLDHPQSTIVALASSPNGSRIGVALRDLGVELVSREPAVALDRLPHYMNVFEFQRDAVSAPPPKGEGEEAAGEVVATEERESGELLARAASMLYGSPGYPLRPVSPTTHIALLQREADAQEKARVLVSAYVASENWNSAAVVLRTLPPEESASERRSFVIASASAAADLLKRGGDEDVAERWLELAEEFDADNPSVVEVRAQITRQQEQRGAAVAARRHAEGVELLTQARVLLEGHRPHDAKLLAAKALGFEGLRRDGMEVASQPQHPPLLTPGSPEWQEARDLARYAFDLPVVWSAPVAYQHPERSYTVRISPAGDRIGLTSESGVVVWDRRSGERRHTFEGGHPVACEFHPTRPLLVVGGREGRLQLFNLETGSVVKGWDAPGGGWIWRARFSPDGSLLALGLADGSVQILETGTWKVRLAIAAHSDSVSRFCFRPRQDDNATFELASSGADGTVKLWSSDSGELIRTFRGSGESIGGVAFADGGTRLLASERFRGVYVWDVESGEKLSTIALDCSKGELLWLPHRRWVVAGGEDNTIQLWNLDSGELVAKLAGHTTPPAALSASGDEKILVSEAHDEDWSVRVWDLETLEQFSDRGPGASDDRDTRPSAQGEIQGLAVDPTGRYALSTDARGNTHVRSLATGAWRGTLPALPGGSRFQSVFVDAGDRIAQFSDQGFSMLDAKSLEILTPSWTPFVMNEPRSPEDAGRRSSPEQSRRLPLAVAPNRTRCIVQSTDGSLHRVDLSSRRVVQIRPGRGSEVRDLAWHPDGVHILAIDATGTIEIRNVEDRETANPAAAIRRIRSIGSHGITVSPNGRFVVAHASYFNTLRLFDFVSGELRGVATLDSDPGPVAFTADSEYLGIGTRSGRIEIREVELGLRLLTSIEGRNDPFTAMAFTPDGGAVLTGTRGGDVRLREITPPLPRFSGRERGFFCFDRSGTKAFSGAFGGIHEVDLLTETESAVLAGHDDAISGLIQSADYRRFAAVYGDLGADGHTVQVVSAESGEILCTTTVGGEPFVGLTALNRDGSLLAAAGSRVEDPYVEVVEVDRGESVQRIELPKSRRTLSLTFSPRTGDVLFATHSHFVSVEPRSGEARQRVEHNAQFIYDLAFSRDGSIFAAHAVGALLLLDPSTLELRRSKTLSSEDYGGLSISDDGRLISLKIRGESWLRLYAGDTGEELMAFPLYSQQRPLDSVVHQFTPGAGYLADMSETGDIRFWDVRARPPQVEAWPEEFERRQFKDGRFTVPDEGDLYPRNVVDTLSSSATGALSFYRDESLSELERDKRLFEVFLRARNWPSAAVVLQGLSRDETTAERQRLVRALKLLSQGAREKQPTLAARWDALAVELE